MARYTATVTWERGDARFTDSRYSRAHRWRFDGGAEVPASASPLHVPLPLSDAAGVDPEEAFVAALSSCHMLWFLAIAAKRGLVVDAYTDEAEGTMARDDRGRLAMTRVVLRPRVRYAGAAPDEGTEAAIHHESHEACYIANSVRTEVVVEAPAAV
jgi:organic hydroperoxide reductase OsmC/OhrA